MPMASPRHQRICERLLTVSSLRVSLKRQGPVSNSSGLGRIAPLPNSGPARGTTIEQSQKDDGAKCQSWSNRALLNQNNALVVFTFICIVKAGTN